MNKFLRFCKRANIVTLAAMGVVREALSPSLTFMGGGDDQTTVVQRSLLSFVVMILYEIAVVIFHCHTWQKVQRCYLDMNGRRLRDIEVFKGWNLVFYIGTAIAAVTLDIMAPGPIIGEQVYFWIGLTLLLLNIVPLLVLIGYVAFVRLGHQLGKIEYCDPVMIGVLHTAYDVFSGVETVIYDWLPIPEE